MVVLNIKGKKKKTRQREGSIQRQGKRKNKKSQQEKWKARSFFFDIIRVFLVFFFLLVAPSSASFLTLLRPLSHTTTTQAAGGASAAAMSTSSSSSSSFSPSSSTCLVLARCIIIIVIEIIQFLRNAGHGTLRVQVPHRHTQGLQNLNRPAMIEHLGPQALLQHGLQFHHPTLLKAADIAIHDFVRVPGTFCVVGKLGSFELLVVFQIEHAQEGAFAGVCVCLFFEGMWMRKRKQKKWQYLLTASFAFHGIILVQDPLTVLEEKLGGVQHALLDELDRRDHTLLRPLALCEYACVIMSVL